MSKKELIDKAEDESQNKLVWQGATSNFTKAQKDFNDALNKHRDATNRINEIEGYLNIANEAYLKDILPELEKQKSLNKQCTEMMCDIYLNDVVKLGKQQKEILRLILFERCEDGMQEDRAFYFDIYKKLETTAERNQRLNKKQQTERQIKKQFGFDVDIDELNKTDFASNEERESHHAKYKDFFDKYHEQQSADFFGDNFDHKERKKSKAQLDKEKKLEEAEKLLSTDINKLFKDLAKLIHPDREQNAVMREKKEALMKELSNARDNMNIAEILRIKMLVDELLPNNQTTTTFNDSTIKRFIAVIKTKIRELEDTISMKLYSHPLFEDFNSRNLTIESIRKHIKKEVKYIKQSTFSTEEIVLELSENPKTIKYHIQSFMDEQLDSWNDFRI